MSDTRQLSFTIRVASDIVLYFIDVDFFLSMVFYFRYSDDSLKLKIQKYISQSINLGIVIFNAIN